MSSIKQVVSVDPFCHKQFPEMSETTGKPGNLIGTTIAEVEEKCNRFIADNGGEEGLFEERLRSILQARVLTERFH